MFTDNLFLKKVSQGNAPGVNLDISFRRYISKIPTCGENLSNVHEFFNFFLKKIDYKNFGEDVKINLVEKTMLKDIYKYISESLRVL